MVYKTQTLLACLLIGGLAIADSQCCEMNAANQDNKFVEIVQKGAPSELILSLLPALRDLSALHKTSRALSHVWDHERMLCITSADISGNKLLALKALLDSIIKPTNPISLDLAHNDLATLPEEVRQFTRLRVLYLGHNQIAHAELAKICDCTLLQELDLSSNNLSALPEELKQLSQLRVLYLMFNQITPAELVKICKCAQLQELILTGNNLTALPEELKQLTQLRILNLVLNNITPADIAKICRWFPRLQKLYLCGNNLESLPEEIRQLTQLQHLDLSGNHFSAEEQEHIRQLMKQSAPNCNVSF